MITVMDYFANEMCKCSARTCTDKVNDDLVKWATEASKHASNDKPDDTVAKRATDVMNRYADCMTKVMMADPGGGNQDDPPPPEEEDNPCGD
jgi:hypothetical protein